MKMLETELRLTNIVEYEGNECRVNEIGLVQCRVNYKDNNNDYYTAVVDYDQINLIPLTEEWLIKFGFKGDDIDRWIVLPNGDASELHIEKTLVSEELNIQFTRGDSSTIPGKEHDYVYVGKIEFVHQLQNLVFALTGEELNLEE